MRFTSAPSENASMKEEVPDWATVPARTEGAASHERARCRNIHFRSAGHTQMVDQILLRHAAASVDQSKGFLLLVGNELRPAQTRVRADPHIRGEESQHGNTNLHLELRRLALTEHTGVSERHESSFVQSLKISPEVSGQTSSRVARNQLGIIHMARLEGVSAHRSRSKSAHGERSLSSSTKS